MLSTTQPPGRLLRFTFAGIATDVYVETAHDVKHLLYYFSDHCRASRIDPEIRIALEADSPVGFVGSLQNKRIRKIVHIDVGDGWSLYETFFVSSTRPTVLPPVTMPTVRNGKRLLHGAVLADPGAPNEAVAVLGASRSGKSTLALALLFRGWQLISDDVIIVGANDAVYPLMRPLGVRQATLRLFPRFAPAIQRCALAIPTLTGPTYMLRPRDLGLGIRTEVSVLKHWFTLRYSKTWSVVHTDSKHTDLALDISCHWRCAVETIEDLCRRRNGSRDGI